MCALQKCHYKTIDKFFFLKRVSTYGVRSWWCLFIINPRHQSVFGSFVRCVKCHCYFLIWFGDLRYVTIFLHLLHHQRTVPNVIGELLWYRLWALIYYDIYFSFFFFLFWMKRGWIRSTKWGFGERGVSRDRDGGRHRGEGFRWHIAIWEWGRLSSSSLDILVTVVGTFPGCCQCCFPSSMWLIVCY